MKINQKDFDKLEQLDRIEFMQQYERIENRPTWISYLNSFVDCFYKAVPFILISDLYYFIFFKGHLLTLYSAILIIYVFLIYFFFSVMFGTTHTLDKRRRVKHLFGKFFEIKPKGKKK